LKKLIPVLLIIIGGHAIANEPAEAFENLVDAFYEGDACGVEAGLSSDSIEMLDMMLMMIKMQPTEAASQLSLQFQIALTGEELVNWTSTDLIDALINSPGVTQGFPPREDIEISRFEILGDSSTVFLRVADYSEEFEIAMVREGNDWKLGERLVQSEL